MVNLSTGKQDVVDKKTPSAALDIVVRNHFYIKPILKTQEIAKKFMS